MGIPELVIFDCDGVLVDSEAVSNAVLAEALCAAGVPTTADQAHARYRGTQLQDITEDVLARTGMTLSDDFWDNFQRDRAVAFENTLLTFLDTSAIHVMLELQSRSARQDVRLVIAPGGRAVQRPFEVLGLTAALPFLKAAAW